MLTKRATVIRTAAVTLCSVLMLGTWAQSRRSKAEQVRPQAQTAILTLGNSYDATPLRGITSVVTGDFNGDGKLDVAVVNPCNQAISACPSSGDSGLIAVMLGTGNGGLGTPVLYTTNTFAPNSLTVADLNHDGHPDLVFTSQCPTYDACTTGAVSVMLGNGDGTFQSAVTYNSTGAQTSSVAVADFNGDGNPDLVTTDLTAASGDGGSISVLLGNGNGTFANASGLASAGAFAGSIVAADFNGDGIADLAVVNIGALGAAGQIALFLGHGDGTFQPPAFYSTGGYVPGELVAVDLNHDGVPDLAVANACATAACTTGGSVGVLFGNGDGTFGAVASYASGGGDSSTVAVGDLNGDGWPDLVIGNPSPGSVAVLLGSSSGAFQSAVSYTPGGSRTSGVAVGDFNGDGQPDVVAANQLSTDNPGTASSVSLLLNTASGFLQHIDSVALTSSMNPATLGQSVALTATVSTTVRSGAITGNVSFYDGRTLLSTVALSGGHAVLNTSFATTGIHAIQARYAGSSSYAFGSSPILPQTVGTPVTLSASPNPSPAGQTVTLNAKVTGTGATGNVSFMDGTNSLGTVPVVSGVASVAASTLAAGPHTLTASYSGNLAAGSATLSETVLNSVTVGLTSSIEVAVINNPVTYTITVTGPSGGTPTGNVVLKQGTAYLGAVTLANGSGTFTTSFSQAGAFPITAAYLGDSLNQAAISKSVKQGVAASLPVPSKIAVTSSAPTTVAFQPLTLTAAVTSFYGAIPNGETVTFYDGSNAIGTGTTAGGMARLVTTALSVAVHSITAVYAGDSTFQTVTSAPISQTVSGEDISTTMASNANPASSGEPVTLTVTLKAKYGTIPDGETITFQNGSTTIGTGTTAGGIATLNTTFSAVGDQFVTASYPGDANFLPHVSGSFKETIKAGPTSVVVTSGLNPAFAAESVTLSAQVTGKYGSVPDGETVTFSDGTNVLGSGVTAGGIATASVSFNSTGTHSITASYPGDPTLAPSHSATVKQTIKASPTTTLVTSSLTPAFVGQSVTLTATISPKYGAVPDGETVTFKNGSAVIGTGTTASGVATLSTSFASAGTLSLTASYPGDSTLVPSNSSAFSEVVKKSATTIVLTSSANPSFVAQPVTLTATLTTQFGSVPDGSTVTFKDGANVIGTGTTTSSAATLSTSFATVGSHSLTAVFTATAAIGGSTSSTLKESVKADPTTTVLVSSVNPSFVGQSTTLTATVTPKYGAIPDGETVTFLRGSAVLGTGLTTSGVATLTTSFANAGTVTVTASYPGDPTNVASTSPALSQVVKRAPTTTAVVSSVSPAFIGQPVTLTATVTPQFGTVPDGETVTFLNGKTVIGTALTAGGVAALNTSFSASGTLAITASYAGDTALAASTSSPLSLVVKKNTTTTVLTSSVNPSYVNQPVTLTATVTAASGTIPNGETVTFKNGTTVIGTGATSAGVATLTTSFTSVATDSLTASYAGDATFVSSTSSAISQVVKKSPTQTVLTSSANPSYINQPVTLTATISATQGAVPDGETVTFKNGTTVIGTGLTSAGVATLNTSFTAVATDSLTASYPGDPAFAASTSTAISQVVKKSPTQTVVTSSANPSYVSQPVTFTATISATFGSVPDGETVTFKNGSAVLGTGTTTAGAATYAATFTAAATDSITAIYAGDPALASSTSSTLKQVVKLNTTTNTLTSSLNPSFVGQSVTLTATIAAQYGTVPDGETITFTSGGSALGTGTTAGGVATLTTSLPKAATDSIIASYPGDGTFQASTSAALSQVVKKSPTATVLTSSANPAMAGQPVTLTATITPQFGAVTDGETVSFKQGSTVLGTGLTSGGVATLNTSFSSLGSDSLSATYPGDTALAGSTSAIVKQVVKADSTTTVLTSSQNPSVLSQPVTFTATVTAPYGSVPDGETVTFKSGSTVLGTGTTAAGVATYAMPFSKTGTNSITAIYAGDSTFLTSTSSAVKQVVNANTTTTALTSSPNPSSVGQAVTFTATITPVYGTVPDGEMVTFFNGTAALGTSTTASGMATYMTTVFKTGSHNITAAYAGDSVFSTSTSSILAQVVSKDVPTVTLASSVNPGFGGKPLTLTATVTSSGPVPTGTVTFLNGTTSLGSSTLSGGVATLTTTSLAPGTYSLTAQYGGDTSNSSATSSVLTQVMNSGKTATSLTSSKATSFVGQSITLTATVTPQFGAIPDGDTVTFNDGSTVLGTANTVGGVATLSIALPAAGKQSLTAHYAGDASYFGSTSPAITQTVKADSTKTVLTSSQNPTTVGQSIVLTATVTATYASVPDGETVTFTNGSNVLGTGTTAGGVATLSTAFTTTGTDSITATYAGDANFLTSTSTALSQVVN